MQSIFRILPETFTILMEGPEGGIELEFELDNIYLNLDTSIPCGLIINEVVSNSLKYAFQGRKRKDQNCLR